MGRPIKGTQSPAGRIARPELTPDDIARRHAQLDAILKSAWVKVDKLKAEYAARGEPWPGDDHGDMYDEYGLPK